MITRAQILELFEEDAPSSIDRRAFIAGDLRIRGKTKNHLWRPARKKKIASSGAPRRAIVCIGCGAVVLLPDQARGRRKFCDRECRQAWDVRSQRVAADASPLRSLWAKRCVKRREQLRRAS